MRASTDPTSSRTPLAGAWAIDPSRSSVAFAIKHLGVATVHGRFEDFAGTLRFDGGLDATAASGSVSVGSVRTADAKRDEILASPEFFDAAAFPQMRFCAVQTRRRAPDRFTMTGALTIRDVTEEVTLTGEIEAAGGELLIRVRGTVDRTRFGMPFDRGASSRLLGRDVKLTLALTACRAVG